MDLSRQLVLLALYEEGKPAAIPFFLCGQRRVQLTGYSSWALLQIQKLVLSYRCQCPDCDSRPGHFLCDLREDLDLRGLQMDDEDAGGLAKGIEKAPWDDPQAIVFRLHETVLLPLGSRLRVQLESRAPACMLSVTAICHLPTFIDPRSIIPSGSRK